MTKKFIIVASDCRYVTEAETKLKALQAANANCGKRKATVEKVVEITPELDITYELIKSMQRNWNFRRILEEEVGHSLENLGQALDVVVSDAADGISIIDYEELTKYCERLKKHGR